MLTVEELDPQVLVDGTATMVVDGDLAVYPTPHALIASITTGFPPQLAIFTPDLVSQIKTKLGV